MYPVHIFPLISILSSHLGKYLPTFHPNILSSTLFLQSPYLRYSENVGDEVFKTSVSGEQTRRHEILIYVVENIPRIQCPLKFCVNDVFMVIFIPKYLNF
jgi:hypothetical protein